MINFDTEPYKNVMVRMQVHTIAFPESTQTRERIAPNQKPEHIPNEIICSIENIDEIGMIVKVTDSTHPDFKKGLRHFISRSTPMTFQFI